ncbi:MULTISPECIES: hypothetical protein [unclassified Paraburkholderia]|uniref:hypothetical protein n=1 Tax=unclassified Paraburkholderia TaxID=2615204 RepID=UPI00161107E4|nr:MULTISPECIES: hypothetical protein [unclassified Paraburkholderia]MBB5448455.1 ferredoxin-NADP reductase [Paraburkholderia sp. WSM4177]MBB5488839.1 ferredoxin-NADP reductase [Paraburkholderia sp. WSM4180]
MTSPLRTCCTQITDALLEHLDFLPGQHVMFSVDHRFGHVIITPDRSYTVAGRPMTETEISQRNSLIPD